MSLGKIKIGDSTILDSTLIADILGVFNGEEDFSTLLSYLIDNKNNLVTNLNQKGVNAINNESLLALVGKISLIVRRIIPENLTYTINTPDQGEDYLIHLTWDEISTPDYDIEIWQSTNNGTYFLAHTVSGLSGEYDLNVGSSPTASFKFKIRTIKNNIESEFSNEITVNNFAAMVAPSNLTYTVDSTNKDDIVVNLSWTNNSSYNQIEVWMSHGGNTSVPLPPMVLFATISGSSTTHAIHIENIPGYYYYDDYTTSFNFSFKVRGVR